MLYFATMIKEHPLLEEVPNGTIIWQYMCLSKFIDLLREQKLYFNRIDNFKDKLECTLTAIDKKIFRYNKEAKEYWDKERKRHFISCWVEAPYELALMWDTYGQNGVAIKTTVGHLVASMKSDNEHHVYLSRVNYIDDKEGSSQQSGTPMNFLKIPLTKRKYYSQEQEIRLLYTNYDVTYDTPTGYKLPLDIKSLIEEVRVYPNAPMYFLDVVNHELKSNGLILKASFSEI